jgi:CheY-like chemotaxis protein
MSHELRTPLNSLLILAQLLAQNPAGNLTPKQVEYAEVICSAGSDLLQLINDILDLSKVEAGKMDIAVEHFSLSELLRYVESTFRPLAEQKNLAFDVITAPEVPKELVTDQARLRQVLRNLISNAVKFTDRGRVELRIEPTPADEIPEELHQSSGVLALRVTDTGIGIAEQHLDSVFDAFHQADGTTSRTYGGTGLGLSISRELAHLLGGVITTRSTVGEGICFTLHLPVGSPAQQPQPSPSERPEPNGLVVVEADPPGLLTLLAKSTTAGREASRVRSTGQVDEALRMLSAERFRCLILDLALPDDGARRMLAALQKHGTDVPVLGYLTVTGERSGAYHAERLNVFSSLDELRKRIIQALGTERHIYPERAAPPVEADDSLANRTILVVDDDARTVWAVTGVLELHGARVLQTDSGQRALELLRANPDTSLILMDIMMPELDGYAVMAAIRDMAGFSAIPIIAVTAKAMPADRAKSLAAGATDHVTKPVDTEYLIAVIRRWLDGGPSRTENRWSPQDPGAHPN